MDPAPDLATLSASSGPALLTGGILAAKALRGATASTRHLVLWVTHPAVAAPACGAELVP